MASDGQRSPSNAKPRRTAGNADAEEKDGADAPIACVQMDRNAECLGRECPLWPKSGA